MKNMKYKDAINQLKNNEIHKVYLLYGEEVYLRDRFLHRLKNLIVNKDFEELNYFHIDGKDCSLEKLIDACETLPFMAEKKLVLVRDHEVFQTKKRVLSEEEEKRLTNYIEKIPETTCLVFYGFSTVDARKKIIKEIQKHGAVIELEKLNAKELKQWAENYFKSYDKEIASTEMEYLLANVDYIGKNASQGLLDVENEFKKIIAFVGQRKRILLEDLEKVFHSSFQNDIFKLLDAVEKQNIAEALKRLNLMIQRGEPMIKIEATLGNHIRNLLKVKLLLEEGYSAKIIASKIGIHPFVATKCASQCKGFSIEALQKLIREFLEMDLAIKTGKMRDYIAVELFLLKVCNRGK